MALKSSILCSIVIAFIISSTVSLPVKSHDHDTHGERFEREGLPDVAKVVERSICGTVHPSRDVAEQVERHHKAHAHHYLSTVSSGVTVRVHFHLITDGVLNEVTSVDQRLRLQIQILNAAYNNVSNTGGIFPINFQLGTVVRHVTAVRDLLVIRDTAGPVISEAKAAWHIGGALDLNVYVTSFEEYGPMGFSTFPWDYTEDPLSDGIVLAYQALPLLPGEPCCPYDSFGLILVHEFGHWVGLYHVFQAWELSGCFAPGDYVNDTAPEEHPASSCDFQDTCGDGVPDPIHNYMDYSSGDCMYEITRGQVLRARDMLVTYRVNPQPRRCLPASRALPLGFSTINTCRDNQPSTNLSTCSDRTDSVSVYSFTAPNDTSVSQLHFDIDVVSYSLDTVVAVDRFSSISGCVALQCNDDVSISNTNSRVSIVLQPRQTVYLRIASHESNRCGYVFINVKRRDTCSRTSTVNLPAIGQSTTILSNPPDTTYDNNINCAWLLVTSATQWLRLDFVSLKTDPGHDFVRVYDGRNSSAPLLSELSGTALKSLPSLISNRGNALYVTFTSNEIDQYPGFVALVTAQSGLRRTHTPPPLPRPQPLCDGVVEFTATTRGVMITSNTNEQFDRNLDCTWIISAPPNHYLRVKFIKADLGYARVNVYAGTNTSADPFVTVETDRFQEVQVLPDFGLAGPVTVRFQSYDDSSFGFQAIVSAVRGRLATPTPTSTPSRTPNYCFRHTEANVTERRSFTFTSNSGPSFPPEIQCTWVFNAPEGFALKLTFTSFHSSSSQIEIFTSLRPYSRPTYSFHGNPHISPVFISGRGLRVEFTASSYTEGDRGFRAVVTAVRGSLCDGDQTITLPPTGQGVVIASNSGNVTQYLNGMDCKWSILAPLQYNVRIAFTHFDTEYDFDKVAINDGIIRDGPNSIYLSGDLSPLPVVTVGDVALVHFFTDEFLVRTGFVAVVTAVRMTTPPPIPPPPPALCTGSSLITATTQGVPIYSNPFNISTSHTRFCNWFVVVPTGYAIKMNFTLLGMGQDDAFVKVYDGPNKEYSPRLAFLAGSVYPLPVLYTTRNAASVSFVAYESSHRPVYGFYAIASAYRLP